MILVTGSTGHLGEAVIGHLLNNIPADNIVAFARDENKAQSLQEKGIEVRIGTCDDTASLDSAMQGIERVLLISATDPQPRLQQHKNVVDAAKKAAIKHLVYTGFLLKEPEKSAINTFLKSFFLTEDDIKGSGLGYTILRNTLYTDGVPRFAGEKVFDTGIVLPAGEGKVSYALRREMGEAAANVLLQSGHEGETYELTGSDLYSFEDVANVLSALSGKKVTYVDTDPATFPSQLKKLGAPEILIRIVAGFSTDIKNHQFEIVSKDLETLIGREPTSLKDGLKEIYNL